MAELIGMSPSTSFDLLFYTPEYDNLKRTALLYSRIAICDLNTVLKQMETFIVLAHGPEERARRIAELEWLAERGVIFDPALDLESVPPNTELATYLNKRDEYVQEAIENIVPVAEARRSRNWAEFDLHYKKMVTSLIYADEHQARILSSAFNLLRPTEQSIPIIQNLSDAPACVASRKSYVLQTVLTRMPIPDSCTPWEAIIDFRNDLDAREKLIRLRHWTSQVSRSDLTPAEISEELEYLLTEYESVMRLHKLEFHYGSFESFVLLAAELVENAIKFKFSKLAESLFQAKQRKINLLRAECSSKGNEVAFIVHSRDRFAAQ